MTFLPIGDAANDPVSRRGFLRAGTAVAVVASAGSLTGCSVLGSSGGVQVEGLKGQIKGTVVSRDSNAYEPWRRSMIWQTQKFPRFPDVIVQAEDVDDIVATVNFARENNIKITTRAGGHSWCGTFMRNEGILLDISRLQSVEIDTEKSEAIIGPGVIARGLNELLGEEDLAFPTAHCGMVPLSGYLLGGGCGWNGREWGGAATYCINQVEFVTAQGEVIIANETENADVFWAVRGGGPGLFGVVTKFWLKCFPKPQAIHQINVLFPFNKLNEIAAGFDELAPNFGLNVEALLVVTEAPLPFANLCEEDGCDQFCILTAVAFVNSRAEAVEAFKPLTEHPLAELAAAPIEPEEVNFERLYYDNEVPFPQRRYAVDQIYTDDLTSVTEVLAKHLPNAPSRVTAPVIHYYGNPDYPDGACTTKGKFYVSCYAQWNDGSEDDLHKGWITDLYRELEPHATGSYINEFNQEKRTDATPQCYSLEAWERLKQLRAEWDKPGIFHDFYGMT